MTTAAELTKIRTLPAVPVALVLAAGTTAALAALNGLDDLPLVPAYVFLPVAVFAAGSEYSGGQLGASLLAVPRRRRLGAAKLAAVLVVCVTAVVPVLLPGLLTERPGRLGALAVACVLLSLVGYGLALLTRSVVLPLVVLAGAPLVVTPQLYGVLPGVVRWLPHEAAASLLAQPAGPAVDLGRAGGLLVLAGWAALSVGAGSLALGRRDA